MAEGRQEYEVVVLTRSRRRLDELRAVARQEVDEDRWSDYVFATLEGDYLWLLADADPVAAGRALVPIIGDLLRAHPGLVADVHILPTRGRPVATLLPPAARTLALRDAAAT